MTYFDHYAASPSTRFGQWLTARKSQHEFAFVQPFLPDQASRILEVGPGWGHLARVFRKAGYVNYCVVEPNDAMRMHLAAEGYQTKAYRVPPLDEDDGSYDAILLVDVFEHLNGAQDAERFLFEARRVLRPHGILFICSPDYLHWKEDFYCDYTHNNVTTARRALQLFCDYGFRPLRLMYMSSFLRGPLATASSLLVRAVLFFASGDGLDRKLYKLKLTFLRRFLIVGAPTE